MTAPAGVPPRSAEQTSRLLLSSAFRYDTIETSQNKKRIQQGKEPLFTVKLNLSKLTCLVEPPTSTGDDKTTAAASSSSPGRRDSKPEEDGVRKRAASPPAAKSSDEDRQKAAAMTPPPEPSSTNAEVEAVEVNEGKKKLSKEEKKELERKKKEEKKALEQKKKEEKKALEQQKKEEKRAKKEKVEGALASALIPPLPPASEINLVLFDPDQRLFLGAAYRIPITNIDEPIAFQATAKQCLVVEILGRKAVQRPVLDAPGKEDGKRVIAWGSFPVESIRRTNTFSLCAGNGQLLYLDRDLWPIETCPPTGKTLYTLQSTAEVSSDPALSRLMSELVPPGLLVPYTFAMDTPNPQARAFRVTIDGIHLQTSTKATEAEQAALLDPDTVWSIAVVAHNGYQQLSRGDEVPLRVPPQRHLRRRVKKSHTVDGKPVLPPNPSVSSYYESTYSSYYSSYSSSSSSSVSGYSPDSQHKSKPLASGKGSGEVDEDSYYYSDDYYNSGTKDPKKAAADPAKHSKKHAGNKNKTRKDPLHDNGMREEYDSEEEEQPALGLEASFPIEMTALPVHASTSLVLAIRRRLPGAKPEVLGFCVFPLCLLPMKDRDLRVENLPALQGPFSCDDARLLLAESATPYGRIPYTVTLSLAFHDTDVSGERTAAIDAAVREKRDRSKKSTKTSPQSSPLPAGTATAGSLPPVPTAPALSSSSAVLPPAGTTAEDGVVPIVPDGSQPEKLPSASSLHSLDHPPLLTADMEAAGVGSTTGLGGVGEEGSVGRATPGSPQLPCPTPGGSATGAQAGGVFEFLGRIMEELHRVRVVQDDLLKLATSTSSSAKNLPPALQERLNAKLADEVADVIDLRPQPVAVPWQVRHLMVENAQPILHPTKGTRLDDFSRAEKHHTRSVFGFRLEGLTMDPAFDVPEDVCFMFSFGPLPYQKIGPAQTTRVSAEEGGKLKNFFGTDSNPTADPTAFSSRSYRLMDEQGNGGLVWCEPPDPTVMGVSAGSMEHFKMQNDQTILYIHVYDALTMFYLCSAPLPLSHFHRPYHAEAALIPMDLAVQRDLCMTEQPVPDNVFPLVLHAGQLHLTLFCVGVPPLGGGSPNSALLTSGLERHRIVEPQNGTRLIMAKKLSHAERLLAADQGASADTTATRAAAASAAPQRGKEGNGESEEAAAAGMVGGIQSRIALSNSLHWKRAEYFKKALQLQRAQGEVAHHPLPGVPDEHLRSTALSADPVTMEHRLRMLEKDRDAAKSRAIATALRERLTIRHEVHVCSWRPQTVLTTFENPYNTAAEFYVDIPSTESDFCTTPSPTFLLGPREKTSIPLVIRLFHRVGEPVSAESVGKVVKITARLFTQQRHLLRVIEVVATILPPVVDRRYEVYGPPGTVVEKTFFSRQYSTASLPTRSTQEDLVKRLHLLCATVSCSSSETTTAQTAAMLDPITQHYVTAWEQLSLKTKIPDHHGEQRLEYIMLFRDAAKTQVLEVWELSVFPCFSITTREIPWGQTTTIALPAEDTEDMYCSSSKTRVEAMPTSYLLHLRPNGVGCDRMLLHTLQNDALVKTLLTVPVVYPTPTATQVIELSMEDVKNGPVQRRLTFVHRGAHEEHFSIHHNYKFQLQVTPSRFFLAPGDTQHIHLRISMLTLPQGQLEGRWPMWIFINDAQDKTVESYYLQVVLRMHTVTHLQ